MMHVQDHILINHINYSYQLYDKQYISTCFGISDYIRYIGEFSGEGKRCAAKVFIVHLDRFDEMIVVQVCHDRKN